MKKEKVEELVLEQLRFGTQILIPQAVIDNAKVDAEFNAMMGGWLVTLRSFVWGEGVQADTYTVEFTFPATWWQHFKAKHFPEWLKKKFPVKTETLKRHIAIERKAVFPKFATLRGLREGEDFVIRTDVKDKPVH